MNWIILLSTVVLISLEAVYEGLKVRRKHVASELIETVSRAIPYLLLPAWLFGIQSPFEVTPQAYLKVIVGMLFLRAAIFDIIFNKAAGLKLSYTGTTKLFDKLQQKITYLWGYGTLQFIKAILGFWGTTWLLNWEVAREILK